MHYFLQSGMAPSRANTRPQMMGGKKQKKVLALEFKKAAKIF
jgi:hypothetical protein